MGHAAGVNGMGLTYHNMLVSPRLGVVVAVNAVDLKRFTPGDRPMAKSALGLAADRPFYVMAANLAPHKGQETAIRAIALLKARGHSPLLWLVGEERESGGVYTAHLRELVAQLEVGDLVQFAWPIVRSSANAASTDTVNASSRSTTPC
jgi:glycosyltransferase involved in cell wall biosynthesis